MWSSLIFYFCSICCKMIFRSSQYRSRRLFVINMSVSSKATVDLCEVISPSNNALIFLCFRDSCSCKFYYQPMSSEYGMRILVGQIFTLQMPTACFTIFHTLLHTARGYDMLMFWNKISTNWAWFVMLDSWFVWGALQLEQWF